MSCGLPLEKLQDFNKQLEAQLATAKNTYLKVIGAKEFSTSLIQEAEANEKAVTEVVPEASGD